MKRRQFLKNTAAAGIVTVITPSGMLFSRKNETSGSFEQSFNSPPASARPYTWWHWMNGNVTKDGITRDLEAMAQVGIGGFQAFSANSGIPEGPVEYLSPLWIEMMQHAAQEAGRLGLEFDMHNCMGWSSSGGSWITPELSMQQVAWSEAFVKGGQKIKLKLKQPFKRLDYYKDAMVLAFPTVKGESSPVSDNLKNTTLNGKTIDADTITGFDLSEGIDVISKSPSQPSYIQFEFYKPVEVRSVAVNSSRIKNPVNAKNAGKPIHLETSDDGRSFKTVAELSSISNNTEIPSIANFPVEKAKYFRLVIPMARHITNVRLLASESIGDWPYKANFPNTGYNPEIELDYTNLNENISEAAINPNDVIDISEYMNPEGELNWDAPEGYWTILRFGHTTTGATNHPANGNGLGLECDKYSRGALDFHFNYMLDHVLPAIQPLAKNGKFGMLIDSYEVNLQNWTKKMPQAFKTRRGYDIINYLPVLTGRVVGNANTTERFLWDFRRTCADVMADNYQGRFVELCKKHNIASYTEPYNHAPFEQMQAGAKMDVNMGEFWLRTGHFSHSLKVAASIQNMNGKQVVGAESYTGRPYYAKWQGFPYAMKAQGDFMFTRGLNRMIFHRYAHQPHPTAVPGMTMGQWGFHFERTNTWFFQGKKWLEYIARCQFVLQQGVFVGDVMCYTGSDAPGEDISMGAMRPELPDGYDFQFANSEILMNRVSIEKGRIVLPDGMSFRLFLLPDKKHITIDELRKLRKLVNQGMILVGPKPLTMPSLTNMANAENEFKQIVEELWGAEDNGFTERKVGNGQVFTGMNVSEVLNKLEIKPDFEFTSSSGDAPINYIHRKTNDGHIYFVANRRRLAEDIVCTFRVSGFEPELWNADSGEKIPVKLYDTTKDTTKLPLHLAPGESVFVVFHQPESSGKINSITQNGKTLIGLDNYKIESSDFNKRTTNNFSVSLWVKPETDEFIPKSLGAFTETTRYTSSYPVYPPPGEKLFGKGHTSFCLLVARNGVVVFEKADENLNAVLIAKMPLSGWTHFAVVYNDGIPGLYVNGIFIKKGNKSEKIVHPAIGETYKNDKLFYYDGELSRPKVFDEPLRESKIREIFAAGVPRTENEAIAEPVNGETPTYRFWQNGNYTFYKSNGKNADLAISEVNKPIELNGEWTVNFPPDRGAPNQIILPELSSLHTHPEDGVKYFSGTATYIKKFTVDASFVGGKKRVFVDLGRIAVIVEVILNGHNFGILWKPPYRIDITGIVIAGENDLVVKVTNLWPNRLIGDEQLPVENEYAKFGEKGARILELPGWYKQGKPKPAGGRVTFSTWQHFNKNAPLLESGLIGPVVIRNAVEKSII